MAKVREERLRLIKPLVNGEIVLGLAPKLLGAALRVLAFPGQSRDITDRQKSSQMVSIGRIESACSVRKAVTRSGISTFRSRSRGIRIGNTLRR